MPVGVLSWPYLKKSVHNWYAICPDGMFLWCVAVGIRGYQVKVVEKTKQRGVIFRGLAVEARFCVVVLCSISQLHATGHIRITTPPRMERTAHSTSNESCKVDTMRVRVLQLQGKMLYGRVQARHRTHRFCVHDLGQPPNALEVPHGHVSMARSLRLDHVGHVPSGEQMT